MLMMDTAHASEYLRSWHFKTSNNNIKNTQFFPIWRDDVSRRIVSRIDMKPCDDPMVYSPPLRFAFNRVESPDNAAEYIATFQDLISKVIPDDVMRSLVLEWMAHTVQRPFDNSKTCLVLAGGKGCGKDTIGDWFAQYILGPTLSQNYESNDQFWEKHDEGRFNKLFVKLEEASGILNKKHEDDFKGRITSCDLTINPKGQKPITTGNYVRYFLTTNHGCSVALDEGERRFALIHCGSELIGNMDYWNGLRGNGCAPKLFCKEAGKAVGDWLMTYTVGSFPRVLPRSALAEAIIDATRSVEERFVASDAWDGQETSAGDLFVAYREFCRDNDLAGATTQKGFGTRLVDLILLNKIQKKRVTAGFVYVRC
jgi:phage/plasmid-associated DNA primase